MQSISLDGVWSVRPEAFNCTGEAGLADVQQRQSGWLPAQVPGEIHLDLMRAGQMPEPSLSTNMPECRWPETKSWWYRTSFSLDEDFIAQERQELICDGLDLNAQVFVNGQLAGEAANAFVPAIFDVKRFLRAGENELVLRLTVGSELAKDAEPHPEQRLASNYTQVAPGEIPNPMQAADLTGHRLWGGRKWLRKPQFSYGWDWVDALPNIGIWRSVHLVGRTYAILRDLRLDTRLEAGQVRLELAAVLENLHSWSERACELVVEIQPPAGGAPIRRAYRVLAQPGRNPIDDSFEIPDAHLWWPNGMGAQPLYAVTATVRDAAGAVCDRRDFAIGLRTIEIDRAPLAEGSRFCIRVNGQAVFCHGVNIGPHDAILARISTAKYEALVAEAQAAHVNMIRINGCSIYEDRAFYDACDRAGILVWQDFMFTVANYPANDRDFYAQVRSEAEKIIPLLRHHPCVALWCGDNETVWVFAEYARRSSAPVDTLGIEFCTSLLPELCHALDPRRPYWLSCPSGGEYPNSELEGDCHWWWPAFMHKDVERRIRHEVFDECRARFVSEYGVLGPCHLDSIREYLAPEELHPGSPGWQMHTNTFEKATLPAAIRLHYAEPETLSVAEYVKYGQMFQAILHGHAMEALRFRKNDPVDDCQGALIWSYSDCWGETGWSILDYYLRRKASYYWFRRACAPVKIIVRRRQDSLVTRIVNDTLLRITAVVEAGWWRLDGRQKETETWPAALPANSMLQVATAALPAVEPRDPRRWLYAAVLRGEDGAARDQSIWTLRPHRELALSTPEIHVMPLPGGEIEVSSPVYCHGVHVEDHGHALLSDNWFDLLPGVAIHLQCPEQASFHAAAFSAVTGMALANLK
jgi:beta-mannosidase